MCCHFTYLSESLGRVDWTQFFMVEIDDSARAAEIRGRRTEIAVLKRRPARA
jgi:hypothetical protein